MPMSFAHVDLVVQARNGVGESPVWLPQEQALYWVDIPARKMLRWMGRDAQLSSWTLPETIGCIASAQDGTWLCAMETGVASVRLGESGNLTQFEMRTSIAHPLEKMRFNDGRCDRQGRMRAGTMYTDMAAAKPVGAVYALNDGRIPEVLVDGLLTPNGMAFSPDGRTMYLSDSHSVSQQIWAFDYDPERGIPTNRRLFVDMNHHPGRPDGAAVDEDGCYWTCANDAGQIHRFTPAGRLDRSIALPVKKPAMCAFGGPQMDTLFVTSIRTPEMAAAATHLDGGLFALRPGVKGLAETLASVEIP